jgi:hypothetical protein
MAQVGKHLPSKSKAVTSNPRDRERESKREKERERENRVKHTPPFMTFCTPASHRHQKNGHKTRHQ